MRIVLRKHVTVWRVEYLLILVGFFFKTVFNRCSVIASHKYQFAFCLGDTRQLPSIEPGNMLADIFEGLKSRGFSVELRTNHRAESQLIVDNASR